ncbi:MAG: site-specific DNA-methyltransferase [Deltaproteobacteria bacterium]|nr:site-specific DNA-methyltransferase [Deltaproteobacteria bacterium]
MARNGKVDKKTPVDSVKHKDKRTNIPTNELRDFVAEDEKSPKTMLYPRDTSLDPQLVWKGKDEQDSKDLTVPVVPVYIQEKIKPQAIIDELRNKAKNGSPQQASLFSDFNGISFEDLIDFYHHEQNWSNRMILGDSLMVMTSLAEKERLKGRIQMIYLDPPYGIKFGSNWQVSTRKRDVKDKAEDATRQPEQIRAFRDTWKLGIHSYLAYLRDRLVTARELLTETGSVFVQIGDENVHLVRSLLDEVFGSENFLSIVTFRKKTMPLGAKFIDSMSDYLVWYAKDLSQLKYRTLYKYQDIQGDFHWKWYEDIDRNTKVMSKDENYNHKNLPQNIKIFRVVSMKAPGYSEQNNFPIKINAKVYNPPHGGSWITGKEGMECLKKENRLFVEGNTVTYKLYYDDFPLTKITNNWADTVGAFNKIYAVQTNEEVIQRCLLMTTDPGDIVLDPTCGSGTTAYVAEQWGRRWITCDTSRVALALARTRLMAAKFPYYILADSPEGIKKEMEVTGKIPLNPPFAKGEAEGRGISSDIKRGFVYKRVPHVTLKSIANNPDIKEGMTREQIDAAIAKHADTETLYDQPYEDNKRIRVTGPFTVESISPHRVLSTDEERPATEVEGHKEAASGQFVNMIIENLKKAGVQNTFKNERLKFDCLEPFAGTWINATGEYTETAPSPRPSPARGEGANKRVAISIGPEHGTVGPEIIKEAAKEAVKGVGFDMLIVCGFAFDPHVSEEAKRYGKLTVLIARMNPDLAMGDELLKKTGAGNLFMVFGEPDIDIKKQKDGKITVEIKGVDVYDPTTGQIRNSSTDDIACWFLDTSYNGESFFVRHAYFTGAEEPYDKLKRALKAEIDEAAWATLYSAKSRAFDPPKTGKIAVKVINHYGDEVLKVFEISA